MLYAVHGNHVKCVKMLLGKPIKVKMFRKYHVRTLIFIQAGLPCYYSGESLTIINYVSPAAAPATIELPR